MPTITEARSSNTKFQPSYVPVAVFVGGTSGIGRAMVEAFARYTNGNAHIVIVGRNQAAADAIIAQLPKPSSADASAWKHEFIPCDITLMNNIHHFTTHLRSHLTHINFLVLSAGMFSMNGFEPTSEGLDVKLASVYYSRWLLTYELMPLLTLAKTSGQDAKVMSILGAGQGKPIDMDDLGLKKNFSGWRLNTQAPTYTDFAMEEFAIREPGVSFTHIHPGFVDTGAVKYDTWGMKLAKPLMAPLLKLLSKTPADCAEIMLYSLFTAEVGFTRRNEKGESIVEVYADESEHKETRRKVWDHSDLITSVGRQGM